MCRGVTSGLLARLCGSAVFWLLSVRPISVDGACTDPLVAPSGTSIVLRTVVRISNPSANTLQDVDVLVRLPMREGVQHRRRSVTCNLDSRRVTRAEGDCLSIRLDRLPPLTSRRAVVTSTVDLLPLDAASQAETEGIVPDGGDMDETIRHLARRLVRPETNDTVRAVHNWVSRNVRYSGYCEEPRGVTWALRNLCGDCSEMADVMAALLRGCDIASRAVLGVRWHAGAGAIGNADVHAWVELPHGSARIADPLNGVLGNDGVPYIAFAQRVGAAGTVYPERLCWSPNSEVTVELVQ